MSFFKKGRKSKGADPVEVVEKSKPGGRPVATNGTTSPGAKPKVSAPPPVTVQKVQEPVLKSADRSAAKPAAKTDRKPTELKDKKSTTPPANGVLKESKGAKPVKADHKATNGVEYEGDENQFSKFCEGGRKSRNMSISRSGRHKERSKHRTSVLGGEVYLSPDSQGQASAGWSGTWQANI